MTAEPLSTPRDLGFGSVVADQSRERLLNHDGTFNVHRQGLPWRASLSLFNSLLNLTWPKFLGLVASFYLTANAVFAIGYAALGPGALGGPPVDGLWARLQQAFFFSVETFSTVGYGHLTPESGAASLLMTLEAMVGMITTALATGIVFARFSRPVARIYFSERAVIGPYDGPSGAKTALKFRIANLRKSQIIELRAKVILARLENTPAGRKRRFYDLHLERRQVTFFPLHWTLVHPIDEKSPLSGMNGGQCEACDTEILVLLTGTDETFSQTVHTRSSYKSEEIHWNADFASVFVPSEGGPLSIDLHRMDEIVEPQAPEVAA